MASLRAKSGGAISRGGRDKGISLRLQRDKEGDHQVSSLLLIVPLDGLTKLTIVVLDSRDMCMPRVPSSSCRVSYKNGDKSISCESAPVVTPRTRPLPLPKFPL